MATAVKYVEAEKPNRPQTYAELVAEAEALFTEEKLAAERATAPKGYLFSMGRYTVAQLRNAHIAVNMTAAMRAERAAQLRREFPAVREVR